MKFAFAFVSALTNKGNCCYAQEDYDKARYYYEEALNIDAGSVEALHNLSSFQRFRSRLKIKRCSLFSINSFNFDEIKTISKSQRSSSQICNDSADK